VIGADEVLHIEEKDTKTMPARPSVNSGSEVAA
jgi:hypothetical protein